MKALPNLPTTISFSQIEAGGDDRDDPKEFGYEDPGILDAAKEQTLLHVLKTLPKDRYRVITLLLFLRELGFDFRYEDISSIWGQSKEAVFYTIQRMRKSLVRAGIGADDVAPVTPPPAARPAPTVPVKEWKYSSLRRAPVGKSGFKGVRQRGRMFESCIKVGGKRLYLGRFPTGELAARAYDVAAEKHFGKGVFLNFP